MRFVPADLLGTRTDAEAENLIEQQLEPGFLRPEAAPDFITQLREQLGVLGRKTAFRTGW